jgi:hypothetical protein
MAPTVLYFILCQGISYPAGKAIDISINRLIMRIHPRPGKGLPFEHPRICAVALLTASAGGEAHFLVRCVEGEAGPVLVQTTPRRFRLPADPDEIWGFKWNLDNCKFHRPGVHWVELLDGDSVIARAPLYVTPA